MRSVLQDWVMELPLREQGTLLTAVRGCDDQPKQPLDSAARRLTAWIRWCFMNPADPREVDIPGAFLLSRCPDDIKGSDLGHLPQHWYSHVMHALEVIGYRHPRMDVSFDAQAMYERLVLNLHLRIETRQQMIERLGEDRIAAGTVVS